MTAPASAPAAPLHPARPSRALATTPDDHAARPGPARRRPTRRIVWFFLVVLVGASLLPLGISAWKLIDISREALITSQQEAQLQVATAAVRQLNASIEGLKGEMTRIAEGLGAVLRAPGGEAPRAPATAGLMEKLLGSDLLLVRYAPRSGPPIEARRGGAVAGGELTRALEGTARTALESGQATVSDPVGVGSGGERRTVIVAAAPVGVERPATATVVGAIDFDTFWRPLVGGRRAAFILYALDPEGRLMAAQDEDRILERADYRTFGVVQECRNNRGRSALTTEFTLDVDGRPLDYLASCDSTDQGWGIYVQLEKQLAYAPARQMMLATLVWAGLSVGVALVLAYVLAAAVTRPINVLAAGAEAFARGEFDKRVAVRSRNELGALADTFNTMAQDIQLYVQRLGEAARQNNELFMGTIRALAAAIDEKDPYTRGHSDRVNRYAVIVAKQLGLGKEEIRRVHIASLFHDIGKIGIEDKILRKPATLTDEEYAVMKQHPEKGAQMLSQIAAMKDIVPGMRFHHERWDGSGYPLKLKGEQIPLSARIVAVADAFDAMTTNRPYQKAMPFRTAIDRLYDLADRAFDRRVVAAMDEAFKAGLVHEPRPAQEER